MFWKLAISYIVTANLIFQQCSCRPQHNNHINPQTLEARATKSKCAYFSDAAGPRSPLHDLDYVLPEDEFRLHLWATNDYIRSEIRRVCQEQGRRIGGVAAASCKGVFYMTVLIETDYGEFGCIEEAMRPMSHNKLPTCQKVLSISLNWRHKATNRARIRGAHDLGYIHLKKTYDLAADATAYSLQVAFIPAHSYNVSEQPGHHSKFNSLE